MQPFNPVDFLILVVDDVSNNLQVLGSILDEVGYSTTFATSGQQALDRIGTAKPDLILLDMMMPQMDGLEVCDRLKSNPETREIPIVFLTASQEAEHLLEAFEKGAVDYVTKPFNTGELLARVRNHLELKHTRDQLRITLQELVESRDAALKSAQIKTRFLANMSHEIRTPMNAVLGLTELLLETELTPQQVDYVQTLKNSGNNLLVIINDILDYSKLESGEMRLNSEDFNLKNSLADIKNLFQSHLSKKSVQLLVDLDPKIPDRLRGDIHRLRQILSNLISNAIKFTDVGKIAISVMLDAVVPQGYFSSASTANLAQGSDNSQTKKIKLRFEVTDTGTGIRPEEQEKIFQSFFQAESYVCCQRSGTGLGLAICRQLVQLMNGKIGVESELEKGAKFWFTATFECNSEELDKNHRKFPELTRSPISENSPPKNPPKSLQEIDILIVEDTKINQKVILQQLKRLGYAADCVNNGQEALDRLESADYDIVLMDCQMPVLDGYAATEQLRIRENTQPKSRTVVIGLTAYAMKGDREKCLAAGMDDYLSKPVSMSDLAATLEKWSRA